MANHKSALKRARQNEVKRMRNKVVRTGMKSTIKKVRATVVGENSAEMAMKELNQAKSTIARAAKKGVIHKRNAARKISRLNRLVNSI